MSATIDTDEELEDSEEPPEGLTIVDEADPLPAGSIKLVQAREPMVAGIPRRSIPFLGETLTVVSLSLEQQGISIGCRRADGSSSTLWLPR